MKCPKCNAEISDGSKFCSYCGEKIENEVVKEKPIPEPEEKVKSTEINEQEPIRKESKNEPRPEYKPNPPVTNNNAYYPKSLNNNYSNENTYSAKPKTKLIDFLKNSDVFSKVSCIAAVLFLLLGIYAIINGSVLSVIVSVIQIIIVSVSFLIHNKIIKFQLKWVDVVALILSIALILPNLLFLGVNNRTTKNGDETYEWSFVVLKDVIPQPESNCGEIYSNSDSFLSLTVKKTSEAQYYDYVAACKEKGFTIDCVQGSGSFNAYNSSGYKLYIYYYSSMEELHITINSPEKFLTFDWPDNDFTKLIPKPKSNPGKIIKNDANALDVNVGNTTFEEYNEYVNLCSQMGFNVDVKKEEKSFSAKNAANTQLTVTYKGGNVINISMCPAEFAININVDCVKNYFFSTYDVKVYVDNSYKKEIPHGTTEQFDVTLMAGTHTIKFESDSDSTVNGTIDIEVLKDEQFDFKIYCHEDYINVENNSKTTSDNGNSVSETETSIVETTVPEASTTESAKPLNYSTNNYETAKNGNTGVFSYKQKGKSYDVYWIIDFDNGYVYNFTDGNGEETCERLKIDFGDLNSSVQVTWHDGSSVWSYNLFFKYKRFTDTLVVRDNNGFNTEYTPTNLENALSKKNSKTVKDY